MKLLSQFFSNSHTTFYEWFKLKKKSITGFQKLIIGYEGMCMNGGNFLMEWQVTDKITEQIFFQFTFNLLQITQTQKIIIGFWKFTSGYEGMCMSGESFLRNDKWQIKLQSKFFSNSHSIIYKWLKVKK